MTYFQIKNLSFRFPSSSFKLDSLNLSIQKGELVGFLGPNGAGKSTLLRLMAGFFKPLSGEILVEDKKLFSISIRDRAKKIAFVAQSTDFPFPLSVWEIVEMGRHPFLGRFERMSVKGQIHLRKRSLELCDVWDFKDRFYHELSGGEKQRVLLASALAQTPEALLLDEPTLSLDLEHQMKLFEIIHLLHRTEGLTVIVATHELNLANRFLDRLVLMKNGKIEADGKPAKVLTPARIQSVLNVEVDLLKDRNQMSYFVPKAQKAVKK
jgi:iron complex transport system ATP-binding protein